jgi:integrase/recombinase XerD
MKQNNPKRKQNKKPVVAHDFEHFLQQKGIIPKTISRHQREVSKYENWLAVCLDKTPENATKNDILDYLAHIKELRKLNNTTQNIILQKLKNYYTYLAQEQGVSNITYFIKIRGTVRRHLAPIFTDDELNLLCDAFYYHTQQYQPNRKELYHYPDQTALLRGYYIALTLMCCQALHVGEIENLTAADFDLRKATVTIHEHRKGADRTLQLEALQIGVLMQHFANQNDTPIMPNRNHFEKLNLMLKPLFPKFKDFRQLRTSRITHWLRLHGLRKTQYLAGHKSINATEKYLSNDFETLKSDMDNFHPLK